MKDQIGENLYHGGEFGHGHQYHDGHIGQIGQNDMDLPKGTDASRAELMAVCNAVDGGVSVWV
jgi:hypothetical protein